MTEAAWEEGKASYFQSLCHSYPHKEARTCTSQEGTSSLIGLYLFSLGLATGVPLLGGISLVNWDKPEVRSRPTSDCCIDRVISGFTELPPNLNWLRVLSIPGTASSASHIINLSPCFHCPRHLEIYAPSQTSHHWKSELATDLMGDDCGSIVTQSQPEMVRLCNF